VAEADGGVAAGGVTTGVVAVAAGESFSRISRGRRRALPLDTAAMSTRARVLPLGPPCTLVLLAAIFVAVAGPGPARAGVSAAIAAPDTIWHGVPDNPRHPVAYGSYSAAGRTGHRIVMSALGRNARHAR